MSSFTHTDNTAPSSSPSRSPQSHAKAQPQYQAKCHTCRRRRVRCDLTRPSCLKCTSRNIPCGGYSAQKPLVWLAGGGKQNEYIREEAGVPKALRRGRKKGRPRIEVVQDEEHEGREAVEQNYRNKLATKELVVRTDSEQEIFMEIDGLKSRLPIPLDMKYPSDVKAMVKTIWYFNEKLYPDMDPFIYNLEFHSMNPKQWQNPLSDILWCVLFAVVESHKAIQTHSYPFNPQKSHYDGDRDNHTIIKRDVYGYKSRACQLLNQELRKPETQLSNMTLAYVLSLMLTETQLSSTGPWYAHFMGAAQIIKLRGGVGVVFKQCPWLENNLKYFMLSDVGSATTNRGLSLADAERQLEYRRLVEEFYNDGSGTCVLCPSELFDAIIQINCFRAINTRDNLRTDSSRSSVRSILQEILSFSASTWATRMSNRYAKRDTIILRIKLKPGFIRPTWDDWLRIGSVYHAAVLLYCTRSLALDFDEQLRVPYPDPTGATHKVGTASYVTIQDIQVVARQTLAGHIRAIFDPTHLQTGSNTNARSNLNRTPPQRSLGKTIVWPLFVAGIEAAVDASSFDPPSRLSSASPNEALDLVCSAMYMLSRDIGTLNLLDAVSFLMREWEGNCDRWWRAGEMRSETSPVRDLRWWSEIMEGLQERAAVFM